MIITPLIDFFLPRLCLGCGVKLAPAEDTVCPDCLLKLHVAEPSRIKLEYDRKFLPKGYVFDFNSLYVFERNKQLQNIIHSLKYDRKFKAGLYLGIKTAENFRTLLSSWKIDVIVPVPLHRLKVIERGYNQSAYIAEGISRVINKSVLKKIIIRQKNTLTQTKMNLNERQENIRNAFRLKRSDSITDKCILLVDDVITTGSTLNECAKTLLDGGAKKVYAISPAIAELNHMEA